MKDTEKILPPARFDFVVLTVNDVETSEAVRVLDLTQEARELGLNYRRGLMRRKVGPNVSVALVSFNDKQGVAEADYYEESSILIVTDLFDAAIRRDFVWLKSTFDNARTEDNVGYPFKSFAELEQEASERLGGG